MIHRLRNGVSILGNISEKLLTHIDNHVRFVIPLGKGVPIPDAVVVTWIIMAVLTLLCLVFIKDLKPVPTGAQAYAEALVGTINNFIKGIIGHHWKSFAPYLGTVLIFIAASNVIGIFGLTPPTKDINVTAGLAIMSILLVLGAGIRFKGFKGWLHHFVKPLPLLLPINIMEIFIRPLSLCMRLFGNVFGCFIVMELIKTVIPYVIPIPFSIYFDFFDGMIQAFVFVFLTTLFVGEAVETA